MTDTIVQPIIEVTVVTEDNTTIVQEVVSDVNIVETSGDNIVIYEQNEPVLVETATQGPAGPPGPTGPQGPSGGEEVPLAKQVDFITDNEMYIGEANPGTATSSASWRIKYVVIAGDGDVAVTWADGNDSFDNIWDNRLTYSYS